MKANVGRVGVSCPDQDIWSHVVAGSISQPESDELLAHAAHCEQCANLLREATEILGPETNEFCVESEASTMASITSEIAEKAAEQYRRKPRVYYYLAAAAAALLLIPVSWYFFIQSTTVNPPLDILAEAYVFAPDGLRMAGAPLQRQQLGGTRTDVSEAQRIVRNYDAKPQHDGTWWYAKGREALLAGANDAALRYFENAADAKEDSPDFWTDFATVYFNQGRLSESERLLQLAVAKSHNENACASYNLAQIRFRQRRFSEARALFEHSLAHERNEQWKQEINIRIHSLLAGS